MKLIPLTQGLFAQVDDEDYERVAQFSWYALKDRNTFYAGREIKNSEGARTTQYMHAFLIAAPLGMEAHHMNGDGLNNRRSKNLRIVTHANNMRDFCRRRINNRSGFRGVCQAANRWVAQICHAGRVIHIGRYEAVEDAARARDAKARDLGWPETGMNFPL